jgi:hypothetical protein
MTKGKREETSSLFICQGSSERIKIVPLTALSFLGQDLGAFRYSINRAQSISNGTFPDTFGFCNSCFAHFQKEVDRNSLP